MRPCHFFLRREGVLGIGHLVVSCFTNVDVTAKSASYAVNDFGGGTRKVISNLNGSLESSNESLSQSI